MRLKTKKSPEVKLQGIFNGFMMPKGKFLPIGKLVPEGGFEPPRLSAADFESAMSAVPSLGRAPQSSRTCKKYNSTYQGRSSSVNFPVSEIKRYLTKKVLMKNCLKFCNLWQDTCQLYYNQRVERVR